MSHPSPGGNGSLSRLQQFARRKPPVERCDLCGQEVALEHEHLMEPKARRLFCACQACAMLFSSQAGTKYSRVPRDVRLLEGFKLSDSQWEALRLPIDLAFFYRSSTENRTVACYPSPAGATESLLPLEAWADIVAENPFLAALEPDVEALLANRVGHNRGAGRGPEYFLAPMDQCFKLVGLIRMNWKGLSGGSEVWGEIAGFFAQLRERSQAGSTHA